MMGMIDQLRVNLANPSVNMGIGYKHPHSFLLLRNTLVYAYMEVGRHGVFYQTQRKSIPCLGLLLNQNKPHRSLFMVDWVCKGPELINKSLAYKIIPEITAHGELVIYNLLHKPIKQSLYTKEIHRLFNHS